ncbi:MAG: hypothetical protein RBR53_02120 [Desulforegulaceae bacterium]|nr:hypothetical protein [Desulforegulaceae bacterium]
MFILILILYPKPSLADSFDFRSITWGMPRVEVLAAEKLKPLKATDDYISYKFSLFNQEVFLLYEFVSNNLLSAKYVYENLKKENLDKILDILELKYEKRKAGSDFYLYENNSTIIEVEYGNDYLKVLYKSKRIQDFDLEKEKRRSENEKKHLLSIF